MSQTGMILATAIVYVGLNSSIADASELTPEALFIAGFTTAGGSLQYATHLAYDVAPCESSSDPYKVSPTGYLGFVQFSPATWITMGNITGYYNWQDPWQQGYNSAALLQTGATPQSQWSCW